MMTLAGVAPETFVRLLLDYLKFGEDYSAIAIRERCTIENAHEIISSAKSNGFGVHVVKLQDVTVHFNSDWSSVDVVKGVDNKTFKDIIREGIKLHAALNEGRKHYQRSNNIKAVCANKFVLTALIVLLSAMSAFAGWFGPSASDVRYAMIAQRARGLYPYNIGRLIASSVQATKTNVDGVWLVVWEIEGMFIAHHTEKRWAYVTIYKNNKGNYVLNAIRAGEGKPPPNP